MRIKTYSLGIAASLGITAGLFGGCGGTTVTQNTGASTSSGGSTTTTPTNTSGTTVTATTTVTTATTSTSSTSATGTTPCDMACAHLESCGFNLCQMYNINCASISANYDCLLNCADDVPCANLGIGTLATCQAQCAGDGGAAADGGDGGTMLSACSTCELQHCAQTAVTSGCAADTTCQGWIACANTCNSASQQDPSCYAACDATYAAASTEFAPIYQCGCTNCATECAGADLCAAGMDGGP